MTGLWERVASEADRLRTAARLRHRGESMDRLLRPGDRPENGDLVPVMFCLKTRDGLGQPRWVFDCPWCGKRHSHGHVEGRWGLRASHCPEHPGASYAILPAASLLAVAGEPYDGDEQRRTRGVYTVQPKPLEAGPPRPRTRGVYVVQPNTVRPKEDR